MHKKGWIIQCNSTICSVHALKVIKKQKSIIVKLRRTSLIICEIRISTIKLHIETLEPRHTKDLPFKIISLINSCG